jgi:hypothetical protein
MLRTKRTCWIPVVEKAMIASHECKKPAAMMPIKGTCWIPVDEKAVIASYE